MNEMNMDAVFLFEVLCQMFGAIDRTVLSARTTESDLQVGEIALDEPLHMMVNQLIYSIQEGQYFTVLLQKVYDRLILTRHMFVRFVLTGVMGAPAVKNIPASVSGFVHRYTAFKREGVNRY